MAIVNNCQARLLLIRNRYLHTGTRVVYIDSPQWSEEKLCRRSTSATDRLERQRIAYSLTFETEMPRRRRRRKKFHEA